MKRTEGLVRAAHDQLQSPGFYLFVNLWTALILLAAVRAFFEWVAAA
jgi:hypothetical protein